MSRVVLMGDIDRQLIPSWDRQILDRQRGASVKPSELVTVSSFRSVADAQIAKGLLDQAGIHSMIRADTGGGMYPALTGADLIVRAEDADRAAEMLQR